MGPSAPSPRILADETGWPCQRLRLGVGALLFFLFETFLGRMLPPLVTYLILAVGAAALVSAVPAIRQWGQTAKRLLIADAMRRSLEARP